MLFKKRHKQTFGHRYQNTGTFLWLDFFGVIDTFVNQLLCILFRCRRYCEMPDVAYNHQVGVSINSVCSNSLRDDALHAFSCYA